MSRQCLKLSGIALFVSALALGAGQAKANDPYCAPGYVRVWCEPVYQTVCKQVWCEPVYQTVCRKVWCEPVTCQRPCVTYDHCGRPITTYRTEIVTPGHYNTVHQRVLVTPGHYETVSNRVLVTPGHYTTRRI
jgi:hypothetical protein